MGGPNLEVVKFGIYILFPIGIMYHFGTNLDRRFAVPEFWPTADQTNKVPFERDEINAELERLKNLRLERRKRRLELEATRGGSAGDVDQNEHSQEGKW
ncbi:MAG: hypothetical protein M4579_003630 [Chaenotheca gracillima]|nr:MAG: hypothetical protein M4579_003630 [Chaenotheca gracillima]